MEVIKTAWDFFQNELLGMHWLNRLICSILNRPADLHAFHTGQDAQLDREAPDGTGHPDAARESQMAEQHS